MVHDSIPRPAGYSAACFEIEQLHHENQRLREINEELRFSVQSILDGMIALAPHVARARGVLTTVSESPSASDLDSILRP